MSDLSIMSSLPDTLSHYSVRELNQLLHLYDTGIERQQTLLDKVVRGVYKRSGISDEVLLALVSGDLKLLQKERKDIATRLESLNNPASNNNGRSSRSTTKSDTDTIEDD